MDQEPDNVTRTPREANTTTPVRRGKVLLILPYFGGFGPWFPLYLHGLARQHTIDLLLLSDAAPPALPANARRVEMTFDRLRELATARLGTPVRLHRIRNLCDLKPAYGIVFEEYTKGYEYWAWGDEDMLYGDVDRMLAPHLDGTVDLVAITRNPAKQSLGPLAVLRNDSRVNELAMRDPAYKDVLVSHEHWAYDETSWRYGGEISSFTKIATEAQARGELSIRRGIAMATHVPKRGRWYVYDGRTLHEDDGTEILYYHWGPMRRLKIRWPSPEEATKGFAFDRYGFYRPELGRARLAVRRAGGRVRELASNGRRLLRRSRAVVSQRLFGTGSRRAAD